MADQEQFVDMEFPLRGLFVAAEYGQQPPLTTTLCTNVRGFEAQTGRGRGGSRAGIAKFIAARVSDGYTQLMSAVFGGGRKGAPDTTQLIQMLDVIVDPQAGALLFPDDPFNIPFDPLSWLDISNNPIGEPIRNPSPTRWLRLGGSGQAPGGKYPPKIVTENEEVNVGDSVSSIDALANDRYTGTPTMKIIAWKPTRGVAVRVIPPTDAGKPGAVWTTTDGAIATVFNQAGGSASRIRYTPPTAATAAGGHEQIWYELTATGSSGKAKGYTSVDIRPIDPPLGTYTGTISYVDGDGLVDVTLDLLDGSSWAWTDFGVAIPSNTVTITPGGSTFKLAYRASNSSGYPAAGSVSLQLTSVSAGSVYQFQFV